MPARFQVVFSCFYFSPTPRSYKKAFQSFRFGRFKVFRLGLFLWKSRTAVNIQCSARWRTRESKFRSLRHAQEEYIYELHAVVRNVWTDSAQVPVLYEVLPWYYSVYGAGVSRLFIVG